MIVRARAAPRRLRWVSLLAATALAPGALHAAPVPDDSPAARDAAIARLRAAAPRQVCADGATMGRTYGTACNSREFPAPPILAAPKTVWEIKPGWWGAWAPFLVGDVMLTGSCNNDTNAGLTALDTKTGKVAWRIASICTVGNRRGSMGQVAFHEMPAGQVLMIYAREDGGPPDNYVIDPKAGRILRTLAPVKRGPLRSGGGLFTIVSQQSAQSQSTITALSPEMDRELWQNSGFRLAMNNTDPHYTPTFALPATSGGVMFQVARSKDQPEPPTRQLHAIDVKTGATLWRHTSQPVTERSNTTAYRSDDGIPMVAAGKVIIRVQGLLGPVGIGVVPKGDALRALDPRSGAILWTTAPVAGQTIINRLAVGDVLVAEVTSGSARELWGYRLADGGLAWRRPVTSATRLLASSGGAFYVSERDAANDYRVHGLDGATGTLLWSMPLAGHNLDFDSQWGIQDARGGVGAQGPSWRIGRDGAIYGVKLDGAFKLQ